MNRRIVYPYNEILPKRAAHDAFIFQECAALHAAGLSTTLICGRGTWAAPKLFAHYGTPSFPVHQLPIIRKNNPWRISWNLPFFMATQSYLKKKRPDWVFLSVAKQGAYHLKRKISGIRYLYEVHELAHYPNDSSQSSDREFLSRADLITVTTEPLKEILLAPPYSLTNRIEVIPLAVDKSPLPPPASNRRLQIAYVGQLYKDQGVDLLVKALSHLEGVDLRIIGGRASEIEAFKSPPHVTFTGFVPPSELSHHLKGVDVFVAPFFDVGRMPYVAHTKLLDYASWVRPVVAPDIPLLHEHFEEGVDALFFTPKDPSSLAQTIKKLQDPELRATLQTGIQKHAHRYSWKKRALRYESILY